MSTPRAMFDLVTDPVLRTIEHLIENILAQLRKRCVETVTVILKECLVFAPLNAAVSRGRYSSLVIGLAHIGNQLIDIECLVES